MRKTSYAGAKKIKVAKEVTVYRSGGRNRKKRPKTVVKYLTRTYNLPSFLV